jgi:hypothetical protein
VTVASPLSITKKVRPASPSFGDRVAGGVPPFHELAREPLEEGPVGLGEERDAADQL